VPYLNVAEVESALTVATSAPYTGFTELITLPSLTWEGRQCHAIKIAGGSGPGRPGVYFLGGIHSREWGSADILINFVEQLEQAYQSNTGLTFGSRSFSAADIQAIVNTLDIVVFPQANPDGRNYSMTTDALWRKNRRTEAPNSGSGDCVGVDVNRNYDFLWNFPQYFSSASAIEDSTNPCDYQLYDGPSAFSEPESLNAKWVFDNFPNVAFFVDLHSYGEDLLYSWGDDEDQSTDPTLNFRNPAWDGQRGVAGDAYKEYIPSDDLATALDLANTFQAGIEALRGTAYTVKPGFNLYPTAGTSDDYAYSRHFVDPSLQKVISYTLEWGTEFQPPYSEMQNIINEITCGLLAFCLRVRQRLEQCTFLLDHSTYGQDEIDARRTKPRGSPGGLPIGDAFRVVVDGLSAAELGVTGPGSQLAVQSPPGLAITCTGNVADNGDYGPEVQRFTFLYEVDFPDDSAFTSMTGPTELLTLNAAAGVAQGWAQIELIQQPDPFILHGDPWWLSVDLRVFTIHSGDSLFGVPMGADASDAPTFIEQLLSVITPGQFDSLPSTEDEAKLFIHPTDAGRNVFNFALAKVHYIGLIGANPVRVFFRLFAAQSTSTSFDPSSSYKRLGPNPDGQPIPVAGIQGSEYVTIPFFAQPRIDTTTNGMDQQTDPLNIKNFRASGGAEVDQIFGCWLDINQPTKPDGRPNNVLPAEVPTTNQWGPFNDSSNPPLPIQQAVVRNLHQCLVAEIAFDPVAIPDGKDPSDWDKLAQRNLAWSDVGSAQALSAFEIRPTPADLAAGWQPDELMIDWGALPAGSKAQIYLPAVDADEIITLAASMYTSHKLARVDAHTLSCTAAGITYIPIPARAGANYAGLLSVGLPGSVRLGERFDVVVRQVTNAFGRAAPPPPPVPRVEAQIAASAVAELDWRRVLGAFQLTIPVRSKHELLVPEERNLSVLRWIGGAIPVHNRWYPVFRRYLQQTAGRVSAFGGDPDTVAPSSTGDGGRGRREQLLAFTGKIAGLRFDRYGDFEGFILDTEDGPHRFHSREPHVRDLAERAWRERLRLTVHAERQRPEHPSSVTIREPTAPFEYG